MEPCPSCERPAASMRPSSPGTRAPAKEPVSSFMSTGESLLLTIRAALQAFRDEASWHVLMRNGMSKDFSWANSAKEYVKVYERARQAKLVPRTNVSLRPPSEGPPPIP